MTSKQVTGYKQKEKKKTYNICMSNTKVICTQKKNQYFTWHGNKNINKKVTAKKKLVKNFIF